MWQSKVPRAQGSRGRSTHPRICETTGHPMVMLGTKWPSIISTWSQSAPCSIFVEQSWPRSAKLALRIEGAMIAGGAMVTMFLGGEKKRRNEGEKRWGRGALEVAFRTSHDSGMLTKIEVVQVTKCRPPSGNWGKSQGGYAGFTVRPPLMRMVGIYRVYSPRRQCHDNVMGGGTEFCNALYRQLCPASISSLPLQKKK